MRRASIVILLDSLKRGGVQQGALLLAPQLNPEKYDVRVWSLRAGKANLELLEGFKAAGIETELIPAKGYQDESAIFELARRLAAERVDLINTRSLRPNILGRVAAMMAGTPGVVANYHSTYHERWNGRLVAYERSLRAGSDRFVCVSGAVRDYLTPRLRLDPARTETVYNGLDLEVFPDESTKGHVLAELQWPAETRLVAFVGRLEPLKRIGDLIAIMPNLIGSVPEARLMIAGMGPCEAELRGLIEELDLGDRVCMLGSRDDVPRLLRAADCMALPSSREGFPRVVLEGFAAGAAVVATPVGGTAEAIEDGRNGLLVGVGDRAALGEAIRKTLSEEAETRRRVEAAKSDVKRYDLGSWAARTEAIFDDVLAEKHEAITSLRANGDTPTEKRMAAAYRRYRFRYRLARVGIA